MTVLCVWTVCCVGGLCGVCTDSVVCVHVGDGVRCLTINFDDHRGRGNYLSIDNSPNPVKVDMVFAKVVEAINKIDPKTY